MNTLAIYPGRKACVFVSNQSMKGKEREKGRHILIMHLVSLFYLRNNLCSQKNYFTESYNVTAFQLVYFERLCARNALIQYE